MITGGPDRTARGASEPTSTPWWRGLALGLERLGLVPLRAPVFTVALVAVLCVLAALGVARIKVDDSLSQLFRSNTDEFRRYEELSRRFPSSEYDVLMVVEGPTLLERGSLEKVRDLVTEVQLVEGTKGALSLFSARQPPEPGRLPAPVFPEELPTGEDYARLIEGVRANEIIRGKLLSEDGTLALLVVSLDQAGVESRGLGEVVGEIRAVLDQALAGTGLKGQLSGAPVMQLEIRNAVERDRLIYNAIGFLAGCLIAILFFRRLSFMIVAAAPPLIAILWSLGLLGWLDFRLNMFLNVMTPLIMVIGFSDSMQLTYAARERLIAGESRRDAFRNAVLVVGPACVLTHATAGLSFVALLFSESELIRTFGQAGLVAAVTALVAVLTLVPVLGVLLVREETATAGRPGAPRRSDAAMDVLRRFCAWIAARMVGRPVLYSLLGVGVVAALTVVYAGLEPRYRLADQVPDRDQAVQASGRLDAKLTGANPVHVMIELPRGTPFYEANALAAIGEVHAIVERQAGVGNVWSVETLRRWLAERSGVSDVAVLKSYVEMLPEHLTRHFIAAGDDAVVVTGRIPDLDASQLLPVIDRLDAALAEVRARHPGVRVSVTGLSAIAARNSAGMIDRLNQGLTLEIVFVAAFIGLAFRSVVAGLASILPGLFPVVASGSVLWIMGEGLQFASVVALTVSFGLGLSATIHFLNRLRLEDRPGQDPAVAVERATVLVGPSLILTSVVLACGLAVTVFSDLPSLRLFGWLGALAMIAALVADFLILRPTVMVLSRLARHGTFRRSGPPPHPAE